MMYVSGEHYNVGHPQKYVGALLHNAYEAGGESNSPKAKLPPTYLDNAVYQFPVDSCMRPYRNWTTDFEDKSAPERTFCLAVRGNHAHSHRPRQPHVPPDLTLGLTDVSDWPPPGRGGTMDPRPQGMSKAGPPWS